MDRFCETCAFRNDLGYCWNEKIQESIGTRPEKDPHAQDMLIYSYNEGGSFWAGPKFGCVHHKKKEPIIAFLDESDTISAEAFSTLDPCPETSPDLSIKLLNAVQKNVDKYGVPKALSEARSSAFDEKYESTDGLGAIPEQQPEEVCQALHAGDFCPVAGRDYIVPSCFRGLPSGDRPEAGRNDRQIF